ncbi:myosin-11-like isoform X3 [Rhinatrema bivittatum]|uniref:myosin-11-like isoform X3 n=1 Tax=Rhinatrema bivittatum TaxID=194408 RepID=UPI00112B030A|nr:myosin-11-like isoform X3 [Rhinatrema bivittatum]
MESQPIPELDRKMDVAASSVTSENTDILMEEAQLQSNALPASLNKWSQIAEENISLGPKGHADIYVGVRDLETLRDPLGKASSWGEQSSSCRLGEEEESLKYVRSRIGGSVESIFSLASSRSLQTPEWKMLRMVEAVESQDISLPLLKAILMEREEKINQLSKDLWKMQTENHRLMEEKHFLLSESKNFTREEKTFEEELKSSNHFTFDSSSPIVLQRQIANLKSQINDLQEANESAVLELAKADEDISQQNNEIAKLKAEYFQKIEDSKDEVNCLQEKIHVTWIGHCWIQDAGLDGLSKINRMETCEPGLCEEIRQLRSQSKQLREVNHLLNEENHRLKEEMWDMKRQCQQLVKMLRERKNGDSGAELHWIDLGKKGFSYGDQHRQKGLETDARNGFSEEDWRRSWDGRPGELLKGNGSPVLSSSAGTDFLIADYQENITTRSKDHFKGGDSDEVQELSDNDLSSASHGPSDAHEDLTCHSVVEILSGSTLPRRPFAPRSVADLKIGNLVKFSRPAGKISKGLIKYLGHLFGREDVYVGIELEGSEMGKHDGTFEGRRHFVCKANKGVFVNFNKVIMAWE